jgi:hypothetical protein
MRKKGKMPPAVGSYILVNDALLREKAFRDDPRKVFYQAILANDTYEGYENAVRGIKVSVPTFKTKPIDGHMEIMYARRMGWIEDRKPSAGG